MLAPRRTGAAVLVAAFVLALTLVVGVSFVPGDGAAVARADIIHLNDGRKIVGKIVKESEGSIKVKLKHGTQTINRDDIFEIERRKEPEDLHAEEAAKAETADDWFAIGKQAKDDWGLEEIVWRGDFEKAIELDPEHAGAREGLGYKKVDGKWLEEAEWREAEGFVLHEGRWVTKEKADQIEVERRERMRERVERGTESYRDEIKGVPWAKAWKVETGNYIVRSNAGKTDELTREYADFMELLYAKLRRIFSRLPLRSRGKRSLYILRNHKEFMEMNLLFEPGIGGFYVPGTHPPTGDERIIVAYHGQFGATGDTRGVLAHEGTHQFEHMIMEGDAQGFLSRPIWLIEGLAVLIGDGHYIKGRKMEIGIPRDRLAALQRAIRNGSNHKLKDLIRIPKQKFGGYEYAHAWGLIYYMLFGKEPFNYGGKEIHLGAAFENYLKANLKVASTPEAFEAEVGGAAGLEELETKWKAYILGLEIKKLGKQRGDKFESGELGFKIQLADRRSWSFLDEAELRAGEGFAAENEKTTGRVSVMSQPNGLLFDSKSLADRLRFGLNGRLENPAFIAQKKIDHKGHDVVMMEYKGTEKRTLEDSSARPNEQHFRSYVFTTPKRWYLLKFQSDSDRWDDCEADFDKMKDMFEVLLDE